MPGNYTYPGVYVEEIPSGVRAIAGVSTSDTAFVDYFERGPIDEAVRITSFDEFERRFGGLHPRSEASYAIYQYFLNGGSIAWVVRVATHTAKPASRVLVSSEPGAYYGYGYTEGAFKEVLKVSAASPGKWGENLQVAIDFKGTKRELDEQGEAIEDRPLEFNLAVREVKVENGRVQVLQSEAFRNLNLDTQSSRYAISVVNEESDLIRLENLSTGDLPEKNGDDVIGKPDEAEFLWLGQDGYWTSDQPKNPAKDSWQGQVRFEQASPGQEPGTSPWIDFAGAQALLGMAPEGQQPLNEGIYLLKSIAPRIFNILCLPAVADLSDTSRKQVLAAAAALCEEERAFLIVDIPPKVKEPEDMVDWISGTEPPSTNHAAVYYPRLKMADPLNGNRPKEVGPSGTLAGIYARTDATRGVWKAPAGVDASLRGVDLLKTLTDLQNGGLNPLGANVLRSFPIYRNVAWGARTLEGADQQASEWKYIPIRRLALYIEESLYQGLKWVVFEPNDEPLWSQIRLNVGAFMHNLFRLGAFQGASPREAYFVRCNKDTTTQNDIDRGIVNIVVGFAPLKPAEFVVIRIQQIAGQIQT